MKKFYQKLTALLLCAGTLTAGASAFSTSHAATTLQDEDWTLVAKTPSMNGCGSTQGLAVGETYLYSAQVDGNNTICTIMRVHRETGKITLMKNSATDRTVFTGMAHANDMDVVSVGGKEILYLLSTSNLLAYEIQDDTLTKIASYQIKYNGNDFIPGSMAVYSIDEKRTSFLFKSGDTISRGSIETGAAEGKISVSIWCTIDTSKIELDGKVQSFSSFLNQGMGYKDNTLFIVMAGCEKVETINQSIIVGYDLTNASGKIQPDFDLVFFVDSDEYPGLFEAEDCGISGDGKLYFNTNGRRSSTDTNHDGVFRLNEYTFVPSAQRQPKYLAKYNPNGAKGLMPSHTMPCEGVGVLPENAFTTADKHFDGWTARRTSDRKNYYVNVNDPTDTKWLGKAAEGYELYKFPAGAEVQGLTTVEGDTIVFSPAWSLYGDANGDGKLTLADVVALRMYAQGGYPVPADKAEVMDVNGDGTVNVSDANVLFAYVIGGIEKIPACE